MKYTKVLPIVIILLLVIVSSVLGYLLLSKPESQFPGLAQSLQKDKIALMERVQTSENEKVELEDQIKAGKEGSDALDLAMKSVFLKDEGVFVAFPSRFTVKEESGSYGELVKFILADREEVNDKEEVNEDFGHEVLVASMDSVQAYADNYEGDVYCIDHGACDENFDANDYVTAFNNLKSVVVGDGSQVELSGSYFEWMNNAYYDESENEIKTINGRKFVIINNSFLPSGSVWRSYITYVNDNRVAVVFSWSMDRKLDGNFHQYDAEADAFVAELVMGDV